MLLLLLRCLLAAASVWILYQTGRSSPDKSVMERAVVLIAYGISAYFALLAAALPWLPAACRHSVWAAAALFLPTGFCLFLFSLIACILLYPFVRRSKKPSGAEKILLVLGAPVVDGQPLGLLVSRAETAAVWMQQHPNTAAILSGGKGSAGVSESEAMHRIARRHGICTDRLLPESQSTTTDENFLFSGQILQKLGIRPDEPAVIVTNEFHFLRMRRYACRNGLNNLRYLIAPTPKNSRFLWALRESIVLVRCWLLRK